jgi:hypothetical protein
MIVKLAPFPPKVCCWNEAMENALLDFLIQEIKEGKQADNPFKAKTWEDAVPVVIIYIY